MQNSLFAKTIKSSIWNIAGYTISAIVLFFTIPLLLNILGTSKFGLIAILMAILTPLGVSSLGLGQATIKYVSESLEKGDVQQAEKYLQVTLLFNVLLGASVAIVICLISRRLVENVFNIEKGMIEVAVSCLRVVAAMWLFDQIKSTLIAIPTSLHRYDIISISVSTSLILKNVLGLIAVYYSGILLYYFLAQVLVSVIEICFWYFMNRILIKDIIIVPKWDIATFKKSINFGIWQAISDGGSIIATQADKYLIGILLTTIAVGVYEVAFSTQQRVISFVWKIAETLFPSFSRLSADGDPKRTISAVLRSTWVLGLVGVTLLFTLGILSRDFLDLWVGSSIASQGWLLLLLLCFAGLIGVTTQPVHFFLLGYGHTRWIAVFSIVQGGLTLVLSYIFIKSFGLMGGGIASVAGMVLTRPVLHFMVWKTYFKEHVKAKAFFIITYYPIMVGILGIGGILSINCQLSWGITSWVGMLFSGMFLSIFLFFFIMLSSKYVLRMEFIDDDIKKIVSLIHALRKKLFEVIIL